MAQHLQESEDFLRSVYGICMEANGERVPGVSWGGGHPMLPLAGGLSHVFPLTRGLVSRKADTEEVQRWLEDKADLDVLVEELDVRAKKDQVFVLEEKVS